MAKAIPVFKFAFAAYAASGAAASGAAAREQRETQTRKTIPQNGFLRNWSVFSSEGGLRVKIGVRDGERCEAMAEPKETSEDYREIWLDEIKETASAFSGLVRKTDVPLQHIRPGQRIGFDPTHILDWSIGPGSDDDSAPEPATANFCEILNS